jgi:hypothetical protein
MPVATQFNTSMPSFGNQWDPQSGINALGGMLNNAQAALALSKAKDTYDADVAGRIADSIQKQSQAVVSANTIQPQINTLQQTSNQADITTAKAKLDLTGAQASVAQNSLSALANDPDVTALSIPKGQPGYVDPMQPGALSPVLQKLKNQRDLMIQSGVPEDTAELAYTHAAQEMAQNPAAFRQNLVNMGGKNLGATGQATYGQVPVASQQTPTTDVLGRPVIQVRDNAGNLHFQSPQGAAYQPMMQYPAGEGPNTLPEVQKIRTDAQTAATAAPNQHFLNTQIIQTAPSAFTGSNAPALQKFFSAFGGKYDPSDSASASAQLQHFIAQATVNNAAAAGANTDAAKAVVGSAVLPTDAPEKAIPVIARINDALATGAEMKNKGMVAAIGSSPNDIFEARRFNNDWQANANPNVFRLINAGTNPNLLKEVRDSLGPDEATRAANMKALLPQYRAIKSLTTSGQLATQ